MRQLPRPKREAGQRHYAERAQQDRRGVQGHGLYGLRDLEGALTSRDIVIRGIRPVPPTLEDVFMSLTRTAPETERDR